MRLVNCSRWQIKGPPEEKLSAREDGFIYLTDMDMCVFNETCPVCGIQFVSSQHSLLRNALSVGMQMYSRFSDPLYFSSLIDSL